MQVDIMENILEQLNREIKMQSRSVSLLFHHASREFKWKIQQHQNFVSPQKHDFMPAAVRCWHNKEFQSEVQKEVYALPVSSIC